MNRFIRYFNQNRKKIIIGMAIIAFIIIIIRVIDSIYANINKNTNNNVIKNSLEPTKSIITGENVSENTTNENKKEIEKFVNYCNNKKYEDAYNLLTEDCKSEYSNDSNIFKHNYVEKVFKTPKTYGIELWLTNNSEYTYRIIFYEDNLLATGGQNLKNNYEDYITVTNKNNEKKLSINGFIKEENINKSKIESNVEIIINSKLIYNSYEKYNLTVNNKTGKTIILSVSNNNEDICIIDDNNVVYNGILSEISQDLLIIRPNSSRNLNIRFEKIYNTYSRKINKIKFKNIIMDYEGYIQNTNETNIEKVEIEIDIK